MILVSLSAQHRAPSVCGWKNLRKCWAGSSGQLARGGTPAWGLAEVLASPYRKNLRSCETFHKVSDLDWSLARRRQFNPLNAELNPICHLLALLGAHHIFHVSGLRVKITWDSERGMWETCICRSHLRQWAGNWRGVIRCNGCARS